MAAAYVVLIISCNRSPEAIVSSSYIDSLLNNYTSSETMKANEADLAFWSKRMERIPDNFVNGPKYASALAGRFRFSGDINDLKKADSLLKESNAANKGEEDGILFTLSHFALLQHRFKDAGDYAQQGMKAGDNDYGSRMALFDAAFEVGRYDLAGKIIKTIRADNTYPYFFRRSKYEHLFGSLDSSISYMLQAAERSGGNKYLEQAAVSNAADLSIHKGDLSRAFDLFKYSLGIDVADLHSLTGIGWIALVHDKNDQLAEKIFLFVKQQTHSPDPLVKLIQLAQFRNDKAAEKKWATQLEESAARPEYGGMYNKYRIELYTGVLSNPGKAVELARQEVQNRPTPQAYAWYAWALLHNSEKEKAYSLYREFISGRPLEGPELYYTGKLMQALGKEYNARKFFKAALKNRYDLNPGDARDLEGSL